MSLSYIASHVTQALPSYQASAASQPPGYVRRDSDDTLVYPAPVYTAHADRYAQSPRLEAGAGLALIPPNRTAPQTAIRSPMGLSDIATLGCLGGAGLVAFTLPAVPGIVMVALGHNRHNVALQWAGVGWLAIVGVLIAHACFSGCRPCAANANHGRRAGLV